ncbi:cell division cycle and apoptosis regulator protein 1-like, partial [Uloborus diversus]|uniref:cell division cycle and apoptosis regulator protein 1-like n=1 Tax=Uloborus diversus TaxID=327109 RepID=UPI0024098C07
MSQFAATKNPPWVRAQTNLVQPPVPPGSSLLTAQQVNSAASLAAGAGNPLAVVAQNQQAQQVNPAVSASYTTGLAALTLTQSALQQGAMLQQQGLAIPASLAATTQVANVNSGMVVEIGRLPQPGVALPTSLTTSQVATVSYPAPRLLAQATQYQQPQPHPHQTAAAVVQQAAQQVAQQQAAVAAAAVAQQQQQQQQQQQHSVQQAAVQPQYKQRVITGIVTKLHDNFGFVDEDIFFQTSSVKGTMPKTGERVLVEATYNPSMPFKWTATRIQVLPNQVVQVNVQPTNNTRPQLLQQQQRTQPLGLPPQGVNPLSLAANQPAFSTVGQLMESLGQQQQRLNIQQNNQHNWIQEVDYGEVIDGKMSRMNQLGRRQHSPPRRERDLRRERYRDRYSPPPPRKRSRSPPPRRPSRSPPPRRRPRIIPRYTVQIPKISLDLKIGNVMELRKRYSNLYIPSDFCGVNFLWQEAFPPHRPFSMDHPCTFHIIGKDAEPVFENDAVLDAPDADYSYSAKVMLMSSPALGEIFHKSCSLAEDGEDSRENHVHPARLLQFLVGLRGKNETVALGGPWSPSLDGPDPDKDPSTLVRTAIRTCRALTGIDLGKCIQ